MATDLTPHPPRHLGQRRGCRTALQDACPPWALTAPGVVAAAPARTSPAPLQPPQPPRPATPRAFHSRNGGGPEKGWRNCNQLRQLSGAPPLGIN